MLLKHGRFIYMAAGHEWDNLISHALLSMLLEGIDQKSTDRIWQPSMAVKTAGRKI